MVNASTQTLNLRTHLKTKANLNPSEIYAQTAYIFICLLHVHLISFGYNQLF